MYKLVDHRLCGRLIFADFSCPADLRLSFAFAHELSSLECGFALIAFVYFFPLRSSRSSLRFLAAIVFALAR